MPVISERKATILDEHFIEKIYRTIALTWALAMLWSLALWKPWIALSITLGVGLGTAVLAAYNTAIRKLFVPGVQKAGRAFFKFCAVKFVLAGLLLYFIAKWHSINLIAFCGGIFLTHFAIYAKLAGIKIMERQKRLADITSSSVLSREN